MNLSEPFIRRPVMTTLLMVGMLLFGSLAYWNLPVSDLPDIVSPTITVTASNPGSDAETMASNVATPLEQQMMSIEGLVTILSRSSYGITTIVLQFDPKKGIDAASTDVTAAINRALGNLPPEMPTQPSYEKVNPSDTPVIYVAVSSDSMTLSDLYDYGSTAVAQRFSMVEGVSQVSTYGSKRALRVKLNPDAMAAMELGMNEVAQAIVDANQSLPGGTVYDEQVSYTLLPKGQMETGRSYDELIVAERNGSPIYLSDIGRGVDSSQQEKYYLNFWMKDRGEVPAVVVAVTKESGYNTVQLCEDVRNLLPEIQQQIPSSIHLDVINDSSVAIAASIDDVQFTLILALCLVVGVIFLFLGNVRSTLIPSLALPMAIVGTFALMYVNGYSIDILSMLGLILVVGFLVDDAIVVLENIVRHQEMGKTPLQAALDGSAEISGTVLSMTLALSAVFIPFVFMPGVVGRMFHEFAMVVVIAVLFSGAISLILTPMLCSRFLQERKGKVGRLEVFARRIVERLHKIYLPMLSWVLTHWWVPLLAVSASLCAAVYLFQSIPQDFLPPGDTGTIQGLTIADQGVSLDAMARKQEEVNLVIQKNPYVENMISIANIPSVSLPNQGVLYVILKEGERPPIEEIAKDLNEQLRSVVGMEVFLRPIPEIDFSIGTGVERADYSYYLSTMENPKELYEQTNTFVEKLRCCHELSDVSSNVQNNDPQLTFNILREQASSYGISAKTIEQALSWAYGGGRVSTFKTPINIYDIIIEMEDSYRKNPGSLGKIYLSSANETGGKLVPLSAVSRWEETVGPVAVFHNNQFPSATVYFDVPKGVALSTAIEKVEQTAASVFPTTIMRQFKGQAEVFAQTMKSVSILLALGLVVIYLLLGILYESFIHPLTILSTLPGALFGGLFILALFGATLSLYSYIGLIVLIGIVLKNGIMLVEFANQQVEGGKSARDAIIEASQERFRPILMTTIAAAMGAVPIALGMGTDASSRRPLGLVILGGLFFAQLITYFFTPVVYLLTERLRERFFCKK